MYIMLRAHSVADLEIHFTMQIAEKIEKLSVSGLMIRFVHAA
jgi:hypothetical protein